MKTDLKQISPVIWEISKELRKDMRTSARIFATEAMLEQAERDKSFQQLINVSTLPGIQDYAVVMPDVHEGYGFPIGAVAATDYNDGVISPGGIGYDINCGIRVLTTQFDYNSISPKIKDLARVIYQAVPSGVGKGGNTVLSNADIDLVLKKGCRWAEENGYNDEGDLDSIESLGSLEGADSRSVSKQAKDRGRDQLGTMGSGNHFVEINRISQIYDENTANVFGLKKDQIVIQIHTGSRGLGHQVATDYVKLMQTSVKKYDIQLPDRELCCAPNNSEEGKRYFEAMCASANFAWVNRQLITWEIREAWKKFFGAGMGKLSLLYDVAHNIAKIEEHNIGGKNKKVIVHRKGATRAFPAGHLDVCEKYRSVGQPVLIPGSMGTSSYILAGLPGSMEFSFGSTCHGSGRLMSRTAALKKIKIDDLKDEMEQKNIVVQTGSMKGLPEEAPEAYKDVESVVDVVITAGIAKKIAKLIPMAVIKG